MRIKAKDFSIELSSTIVKVFIDTLMEKIRPVLTENHEFKYRDESRLTALFGIFGLFVIPRKTFAELNLK